MSFTQSAYANAKINLFLDVCGKRADGYHAIRSVMQSVSLHDTVRVTLKPGAETFAVLCDNAALPQNENNIAYRAARRFSEATGQPLGGEIFIGKHIPAAAGMAGGSADAAATLAVLNRICEVRLPEDRLLALAAAIGADVPFCLSGGTRRAEGIGEVLTALSPMPPCYLLCVKGGEDVSTPWAYGLLDESFGGFANRTPETAKADAVEEGLKTGSLAAVAQNLYNIFESVVLPRHRTAASLRKEIASGGALAAMMSGSGPSVFGIYEEKQKAENTAASLRACGYEPYICQPAPTGIIML